MTSAAAPLPDEEKLARFVLFDAHVRADGTVRPNLFIPHPHPDLSVTRHARLPEETLWLRGHAVAEEVARNQTRTVRLLGRADAQALVYRQQKLHLEAAPVSGNAEHINALGWPADKSAQKIIAQEIADRASYLTVPTA